MGTRWHKGVVATAASVLGIAGGAGLAASILVGAQDAAASTNSYAASASGTGLKLEIGGTVLVGGTSSATAGTGAPVVAKGAGELTPAATATATATAASPGASQSVAQRCAQPATPFPAPLATDVALGIGCGGASAAQSALGFPTATATGKVGAVALNPTSSALGTFLPTSVASGSALAGALTSILGTLPSLPATGTPLGTVLTEVAHAASGSTVTTLAGSTVGATMSTLVTTGDVITATSKSTAVTVHLLTGAGAGGGPLLTVNVGQSESVAHLNMTTGKSTEQATPATVSVTIAPPAGTSQTISIAPGQSKSFFTGTPLQTTVSLGTSSTTASKGSASATGVVIDLATGAGATNATGTNGGVDLVLAQTTASASATGPAAATTGAGTTPGASTGAAQTGSAQTGPATLAGATTVHTGEPWSGVLPIALLSMSLLAGLALLARRQLATVALLAGRSAGRLVRPFGPASRHSAGPGLRDLLRSPSGSGPGSAARHVGTSGHEDG